MFRGLTFGLPNDGFLTFIRCKNCRHSWLKSPKINQKANSQQLKPDQFFPDRTVAAAKLPEQGDEYEAGDLAVVSGWGTLSSGGESSDVLMKVEVPIVSDTSESVELIG